MERAIKEVLDHMGKKINARVEKRWASVRSVQGRAYAKEPTFLNEVKNQIVMQLSYGGQKAWVAEYGRGSLMDTSKRNKWGSRYRNGRVFNRARLKPLNAKAKKFSLVSRAPNESYRDLDGANHTATKKFPMRGFNLEYWATRYQKKPYRKYFLPMNPLYIIENEVKMALPEIKTEIERAIKSHIQRKLFGK